MKRMHTHAAASAPRAFARSFSAGKASVIAWRACAARWCHEFLSKCGSHAPSYEHDTFNVGHFAEEGERGAWE